MDPSLTLCISPRIETPPVVPISLSGKQKITLTGDFVTHGHRQVVGVCCRHVAARRPPVPLAPSHPVVFDFSDSEEEEQEVLTPKTPTPNLKMTPPEESAPVGDRIKETDEPPPGQGKGSRVVRKDHPCGHQVRTC